MHIRDLTPNDHTLIEQIAEILVAAFGQNWPEAWPDKESALKEVQESLQAERISRVALDAQGEALGWIGGISTYDGNVWELHPLAVSPQYQGQGLGRALVTDFEAQVQARGGYTIMLGSDDETQMTTLAGVDLYPNVWAHVQAIRNLRRHPYEFYQKLGYQIVGVIPDANGPGKPDIYMAKRVRPLA